MAIHIDHNSAKRKLTESFKKKVVITDEISKIISSVITGSHKTYKYVLITGLLAKATTEDANPLALQAGAPIDGAYDARSLCHKVIVPFERNFLANALGGSNEPFLNKPARFTHLSKSNAVRNGNDRTILNNLIKIFTDVKTSIQSEKYLIFALNEIYKLVDDQKKLHVVETNFNPTLSDIYNFIIYFISKSFEGETCTIVVSTLEKMFYAGLIGKHKVIAHKVNQSGASSKETGDIDIFKNDNYSYSIEVKDKEFSVYDLEHAFNKVLDNKGSKGAFIYGPRGTYDDNAIKVKLKDFEKKKFVAIFLNIYDYAKIMLLKTPNLEKDFFVQELMNTAIEINCKGDTRKWIKIVIKDLKW